MSVLTNEGKPWKAKTWEDFCEEKRQCWDCKKFFKVKNMVMNIDYHYHCKECAKQYEQRGDA